MKRYRPIVGGHVRSGARSHAEMAANHSSIGVVRTKILRTLEISLKVCWKLLRCAHVGQHAGMGHRPPVVARYEPADPLARVEAYALAGPFVEQFAFDDVSVVERIDAFGPPPHRSKDQVWLLADLCSCVVSHRGAALNALERSTVKSRDAALPFGRLLSQLVQCFLDPQRDPILVSGKQLSAVVSGVDETPRFPKRRFDSKYQSSVERRIRPSCRLHPAEISRSSAMGNKVSPDRKRETAKVRARVCVQ